MNKYKIKSVDEMSVEELIGQLIMIGIPNTELDSKSKEFIKQYKIGNLIYFSRNYKDTKQIKKLNNEVYDYISEVTGSFPLISIDQEGGMVTRLFTDVTFPASPMTTSGTNIPNAPYEAGFIIGEDMLKLGLNLNLAPCLEINNKLENYLVNVRSYGGNKHIVLENAKKFVKGLHDSHALSCLKHFPGAGSSNRDSHLVLPIIEDSLEDLKEYNLYPFIHLLETDAIMSSHCLFKSFDDLPTTLSHKLLTEFLREEVGYRGLIISDGMEMKAISDNYGVAKGSVMALKAGCDILLLCHYYDEQKSAFDAVLNAYHEGILTLEEIKEKVRRINKAKERVLVGLNKYFNDEEYKVVKNEHKLMQDIVDESYTLINGTKPYLDKNTLVLAPKALVSSIVEDEFDSRNLCSLFKKEFKDTTIYEFSDELGFNDKIINSLDKYNHILIYSYDAYRDNNQLTLINEILNKHHNVHLVSLKGPMDKVYFNNPLNYSCLYEYTPNSLRTVVKQLKQNSDLLGHLPL